MVRIGQVEHDTKLNVAISDAVQVVHSTVTQRKGILFIVQVNQRNNKNLLT